MRTICLYFQIHQPFRLRRYRFFDIGNDHYYYDDYLNESVLRKVANHCYLPANRVMLDLIKKHKERFRLAFSISGMALEQFEMYAPEVLASFKELAATGQVEFLAETYSHSLASLKNRDEFEKQVRQHTARIHQYFGQTPTVFRNTELIYSDEIGSMVADMGFRAMITEGAKHILGWKSPSFVYCNAINPRLKILLKNFKLSDDIAFRFSNKSWSEWPLTAEKFVGWLKALPPKEEVINLFMDYETFGEHQWTDTGIFEFLKALPDTVFKKSDIIFMTPSEVVQKLYVVSAIHVPYPISWADEERDLTAWLGNPLQEEAFNKLYDLREKVQKVQDPSIQKDWEYLQNSDHFYYMCTKFFSDGAVHSYFNPYHSPYDAFINYMNIISDFTLRLNAALPESQKDIELSQLTAVIREKEALISKYEEQLRLLKDGKKPVQKRKTPVRKPGGKVPTVKKPAKTSTATGKTTAGGKVKKTTKTGRN